MRDLLNELDAIAEATLDASTITKYPERFDAFISHIQAEYEQTYNPPGK